MSLHNEQFDSTENPQTGRSNEALTSNEHKESSLTEIIRFIVIALLIVLPIRFFVAQPFIVSGASMEDTFHNNQYLIVDELTYHFEDPRRGDVIIFRYPKNPSQFFIKRVIGLPGDTITIDGSKVTITNKEFPEGRTLTEPYINGMHSSAYIQQTLNPGEYFVMGDNRDASSDSRIWGTLPRENIVGRAFIRLFPLSQAGVLPGAYDKVDMSLIHVNQ